jgi:hypothetical protein
MKRGRRLSLVLGVASAICLVTAFAGTALASIPTGKGDPQPEFTPFKLGNLSALSMGGSIAMKPDGGMVAVYDIPGGNGRLLVCVLDRGKDACSSKTVLSPLGGDTAFGVPQVFVPSANDVVVLQNACCFDPANSGGDLLFTSTDGGNTFGPPVRVGSLGVNAAALIGNQIVFTAVENNPAQVESISVNSPAPVSPTTVNSKEAFDVGVGSYRGGALVATDYLGPSFYTTYIEYASAGNNFNEASSYHQVGSFGAEQLLGMSGDAMLTVQTSGKQDLLLRIFNGRGFGTAQVVPDSAGCNLGCDVSIDQDPSGAVHVFNERSAFDYDLLEFTSTDGGQRWEPSVNLGNAIADGFFEAALDSHGSGLVLGTAEPLAYPVLATQGVSFKLQPSSIRPGKSATGSGRIGPHVSGRLVQLQERGRSGTWYNVKHGTTHTTSGGYFSFKITGGSKGTFKYRAVAGDLAGYLEYGYSNAGSLRVTG